MSYKFSLEVLLDHRRKLEDEARRLFFEAQSKVDAAVAELNTFYEQVDSARAANHELAKNGTTATSFAANDLFISGQKYRIEAQRMKIRDLKTVAEELQDALVTAAKETKTLEKLKEREIEEYKIARRKREMKETDEIVTLRHKNQEG